MQRRIFYGHIRKNLFSGRLMQAQVDGLEILLNEWEHRELVDTRWLAYILATTFHETAHTMQPIAEYGYGRGRSYGKPDPQTGQTYYGRGYVQLTWADNYKRFGERLDIDLLNEPDRAMEPQIATRIIFEGMIFGMFTGRKLRRYFKEESDWYNARTIINRLDRAEKIGRYARAFWHAILMAEGKVEQAQQIPRTLQAPWMSPRQTDDIAENNTAIELQELAREFGHEVLSDDEYGAGL